MMKTRILTCVLVIVNFFVLGMLPVTAQEDDCYGKNGNWMSDTHKCVVSVGVRIDVDYPVELAQFPRATGIIDAFIKNQTDTFIDSYVSNWRESLDVGSWTMHIYSQIYKYSNSIQTVVFNVIDYRGANQPSSEYTSFTFDLRQGKQLTLADVFNNSAVPWDKLSKVAQESLKEIIGKDLYYPTWVEAGTSMDNHSNYKNWALTDHSLILFFETSQVAPYIAGPQKVEIPFSTFGSALAAPFAG